MLSVLKQILSIAIFLFLTFLIGHALYRRYERPIREGLEGDLALDASGNPTAVLDESCDIKDATKPIELAAAFEKVNKQTDMIRSLTGSTEPAVPLKIDKNGDPEYLVITNLKLLMNNGIEKNEASLKAVYDQYIGNREITLLTTELNSIQTSASSTPSVLLTPTVSEALITPTVSEAFTTSTRFEAFTTSTRFEAFTTSTGSEASMSSTTPSASMSSTTPSASMPSSTPSDSMPSATPSASMPSATPSGSMPSTTPSASMPSATPSASMPSATPSASMPSATPSASMPSATPSASMPSATPLDPAVIHGKEIALMCRMKTVIDGHQTLLDRILEKKSDE